MPLIKSPLGLEYALLGFLRTQPTHAYEIHQMLLRAEALGLVWRLKQAHLYSLLARLEEEGCIESTTQPQGTRPPRKVLELTTKGREDFQSWLLSPVEHGRDFRLEFLAKLYFAQEESPAATRTLLDRQRTACRDWLAELRTQAETVEPARRYDRLVCEFRIGQLEATLLWLDECEQTLAPPPGRIGANRRRDELRV